MQIDVGNSRVPIKNKNQGAKKIKYQWKLNFHLLDRNYINDSFILLIHFTIT